MKEAEMSQRQQLGTEGDKCGCRHVMDTPSMAQAPHSAHLNAGQVPRLQGIPLSEDLPGPKQLLYPLA